jgi:hypothetical protein
MQAGDTAGGGRERVGLIDLTEVDDLLQQVISTDTASATELETLRAKLQETVCAHTETNFLKILFGLSKYPIQYST